VLVREIESQAKQPKYERNINKLFDFFTLSEVLDFLPGINFFNPRKENDKKNCSVALYSGFCGVQYGGTNN
jgi:hypothetical protein